MERQENKSIAFKQNKNYIIANISSIFDCAIRLKRCWHFHRNFSKIAPKYFATGWIKIDENKWLRDFKFNSDDCGLSQSVVDIGRFKEAFDKYLAGDIERFRSGFLSSLSMIELGAELVPLSK